jgi:hypothetical protein
MGSLLERVSLMELDAEANRIDVGLVGLGEDG